jgi:polyhydroxyalkanoate synthesis regulator phasin
MKRINVWVVLAVFAAMTAGMAVAQSLGDVAREQRKKKADKPVPTKVYTDDDIPSDNRLKDKPAEAPANPAASPDGKNPDAKAAGDKKPAPGSVDEYKEKAAEWKKKIDAQKKVVEGLQQQLDGLQQQYRLRATAYYTDAGLRLRDGGSKWGDDEQSFRKAIDEKQKEVDAAKQKLADLQDEAHRAGAPNSVE